MNTVIWSTSRTRSLLGFSAVQVEPFPTIADEPVSVADVVRHLKWPSGTPEEADIPRWIAAARSVIERETGIALAVQAWEVYLDDWGRVPGWISLPLAPVIEVTAVDVLNEDGTDTSMTDFEFVGNRRPGRLVFSAAPSLSAARSLSPIRIRYRAGHEDPASIPADLRHALLMQVADFAMHRGDERELATARTVAAAEHLIRRYVMPEVV